MKSWQLDMGIPISTHWTNCQVQDVAELYRGISYKKEMASKSPEVGYKPILRANNINGEINFNDLVYVPNSLIKDEQVIRKDDIIFAMSSGSIHLVGKSAQAKDDFEGSFGAFCGLLRSSKSISRKFLFYIFQDKGFRNLISRIAKGSNINNLKREHILGYDFKLPPRQEQNRIVAKIEELFSELDKGIESLKTARQQLKVYRQALLKHAFEGKLTEQWRKENGNQLETTDQLLVRIKQEREAHYQQQLADWKEAVKGWEAEGKKGKKPVSPPSLKPFRIIEQEVYASLPALPNGWAWVEFINLIEYVTSGSRGWAKYYSESGAIFIRAQNLKYDSLDLSDIAYVKLPKNVEGKRTLSQKGDLLITITGANVTKTAYVKDDLGEAYVSQHVALCRLVNKKLANYLFMFLIAGTAGRRQLEKSAYGAGKPGLNLDNIKELFVPIASISECAIVAELLEQNNSILDQIDRDLADQISKSEALRQSILKKAFSGQLVPQDPNDEPARVLLERIAAEKAELEKQAKTAKDAARKTTAKTKTSKKTTTTRKAH